MQELSRPDSSSEQTRPVVVITGASAGIGRAAVRKFASGGYDVGLIARGRAGLEAAADEVRALGGHPVAVPCDVSDAEAVEAAAERIESELRPIDVWVNNAMASVFSSVKEMSASDFERVTKVTYLGYVHGTLAALRRMLPRDRGTIIQIGSALAYRSIPLQSAYCAAKHAIVGFTDSLRSELIHDRSHVRITAVHMPAVNTPQFGWVKSRLPHKGQPVPPIFQPEVAAEAIYWSAHHRRRELWVSGSTYKAIIGQMIAPWYADRALAKQGYGGQQTDEPRDTDRDHNLFAPLDDSPGSDRGAHGDFDESASSQSLGLELATRSRWLAAGVVGIGVGAGLAMLQSKVDRLR